MHRRTWLMTLILLAAGVAHAHLDTLSQVIEPDPLVRSFEAESLPTLGQAKVIDDTDATGGKAVLLTGEGAGFKVDLGTLPVGMHVVFLCAKVTDPDAIFTGAAQADKLADGGAQQRKPLYIQLKVDGRVHRMRVPFSDQYEYMTKIYFHTPVEKDYPVEITIGSRSAVRDLTVDRVEVRNPLGGFVFAPLKEKQVLYTPDVIRNMRVSAAREGKFPNPLRPQPLSPEDRAARDDVLWHAVMPIDSNPGQIYGIISRGNSVLTKLMRDAEEKAGKPLGKWERASGRYPAVGQPWRLVNKELGLEYTLEDYLAGRTLPAPWPLPEDQAGIWVDKDVYGTDLSFNYGIVPAFVQQQYHAVLDALGATPQGHSDLPDLPGRYLLLGDIEAAADGALLLTAYAYNYPAYDWNMHCMIRIIPAGRTFEPSNVYGRGCSYEGWSTGEIEGVVQAYDKLFPYIVGNQDLANRVGRFVPWVKTPDDVVKLIDTFLVQRAARDGIQHVLYAPITPTAAIVLGPNDVSKKYLDEYFGRIYLRDNLIGFLDDLVSGYSRDGLNYIGSTFYTVGESSGELIDIALRLKKYVQAGGDRRFDIADPRQHPRLAAMPDSILRLHIAGGLRPGAGDVMDPAMVPRLSIAPDKHGELYLNAWRWTKDPRFAWVLVHMIGQGEVPDREWDTIKAQSETVVDPIMHQGSNVLEGFGLAMLNEGVESTDRRDKNAVSLRFGMGSGHAHSDTLDLEVYSDGVRSTSDLGGRSSGKYGHPNCMSTYVHNLVEVDESSFNSGTAQNASGIGWLEAFKPNPGAQFVQGGARAEAHPDVSLYRRGVLQVMCAPGKSYIFDVFRVAGGKVHTWCFHGCVSEEFSTNAGLQPATSELATRYLADHLNGTRQEGTAPAALEATWLMRRKEVQLEGFPKPLRNAEKLMLGDLYDEAAPRKYTRVTLFGHQGAKVMAANWYARSARQHSFPFLYVRQDDGAGQSAWMSLIEPYAGEPFVTSKKQLGIQIRKSLGARNPLALQVTTAFGQTDLLFSAADNPGPWTLEDGSRASGDLSFVSIDADGVRLAELVGGTELSHGPVAIKVAGAAYKAGIRSVNYAGRQLVLDATWPALLAGEIATIGNDRHTTTYKIDGIRDNRTLTMDRTATVLQAGVDFFGDNGDYVVLDTAPQLYNYHPGYYDGMTVYSEDGRPLGIGAIATGDRFWYLGFPEARRSLNKLMPADVTDANGDGKVTLELIARERVAKFAPDGETLVWTEPGQKMFDLDVTRVREDGLMVWTKQHPREYLDSLKIPHPGWPYHKQFLRTEDGKHQVVTMMPGDTYKLSVPGKQLTEKLLPDSDGDGHRIVGMADYGPGDTVTIPTHVYLRRLSPGVYELRANTACEVTLPGTTASLSADGGKTWTELAGEAVANGGLRVSVAINQLADGIVQLKLGK